VAERYYSVAPVREWELAERATGRSGGDGVRQKTTSQKRFQVPAKRQVLGEITSPPAQGPSPLYDDFATLSFAFPHGGSPIVFDVIPRQPA